MFPIQTLYYYIENTKDLFLGSTYFRIILLVIPSFIWPEKPISLAREFVVELGGGIGYAFTPFTEAFMNFSYFFPIILPILFIFLIRILYKIAHRLPIIYLVIFMQIISFNRSESSASLYESLIFFILLTSMYLINNFNIRRV
jgi:hypothetical protein